MTVDTITEQWQPIRGYRDYYEVSDLGRVKSLARNVPRRDGRSMPLQERILKPATTRNGHRLVVLCDRNGVKRSHKVHLLVLRTFVGKVPPDQETTWANGDRTDCRLANISYAARHRPNLMPSLPSYFPGLTDEEIIHMHSEAV